MPTELPQFTKTDAEPISMQIAAQKRRPRGTSVKAVSSAAANAVLKISTILAPLDEEQRGRVQRAVNALLGEAD